MDSEPKESRRVRRTNRRLAEIEIEQKERELADPNRTPQTTDDFERHLVALPSSSYLWIRYMSHLLTLGEVDQARLVGERGLKSISDDEERLNISLALLNLEHHYGSPATLDTLLKRTFQLCDEKRVFRHMISLMEASQCLDKAEQFHKDFLKKYKHSCKVWKEFCIFLHQQGRLDDAKQLLERSLQSLPQSKHVKMISHCGISLFSLGHFEEARLTFERLLQRMPKRTDLWSVYLDMEERYGSFESARALFDRILTLPLNAHKMRFFFNRYRQYEASYGTPERVRLVEEKARAFLAAKAAT